MAIPLVVVLLAMLAGFSFVAGRLRRTHENTLLSALVGADMEALVLAGIEEVRYQLAMAHPPAGSSSAAQALVDRAADLGPDGEGWEGFPAPGEGREVRPRSLDHRFASFLLESDDTLHYAPVAMAATLAKGAGMQLAPVEVRVVRREVGRLASSPFAGDLVPSPAVRAALGLPPEVDALRTTWGVLELRGRARRGSLLRGVTRVAAQRHLFAVVEYTPSGEAPRRYGHVFPAPLALAVRRG